MMTQDLDWQHWVDRFDRMQDRYLVARLERLEIIVVTIRAVRSQPRRVLDLGCGTGSLSEAILEAFPGCQVVGVDLDASLLLLAEKRLQWFSGRVKLLNEDLRGSGWMAAAGSDCDAVVSATALHWLSADHLAELYRRLGTLLKPGGIFLNADHVADKHPEIRNAWQEHKHAALAPLADREG